MREGKLGSWEAIQVRRVARFEFFSQQGGLVLDLPPRDLHRMAASMRQDAGPLILIPSAITFLPHPDKVIVDSSPGIVLLQHPLGLRVVPVSGRSSGHYPLDQEGFPPQSAQPRGVQVAGVDAPQSHGGWTVRQNISMRRQPFYGR